MIEDLEIDYNDQFYLAFRAGYDLGVQAGSEMREDVLWMAFLEYLEEGEPA